MTKHSQRIKSMGISEARQFSYVLIFFTLTLSLLIPCVNAGVPTTGHPYLLFHDITEVPGYQYHTLSPWNGWEASIITSANYAATLDFYSNLGGIRILYRGGYARDLGLAYQITKKPIYAEKAREALLNLDVGDAPYYMDRSTALCDYSLAYDWIQPTLDTRNDTIIRDKLAQLADRVYNDLNSNGTTRNFIDFGGYHGMAYPQMGVAGAALYDYSNPNHLPLTSTPADWQKVGKEYLFENDKLHKFDRSLFSFGFDETSGKHLNGEYKAYVVDQFALWFQVSNHAYGENLLEKYPAAKKAVLSETWESLPNEYSANYDTLGNTGWTYHKGIINLLTDSEKSIALNHIDRVEKSTLLPHSYYNTMISGYLLYCVYGNYASIPRAFPATTNYLDAGSIYQVFRKNWNDDSDWLSLVTFNRETLSNRDMLHGDQMSIEYYSRGDLLLADAGEDKYVMDRYYGDFDIHHNTISIENPRTSFGVSPWSGSTSQGIFKGWSLGMATPVTVNSIVQMPWMQLIRTTAPITKVEVGIFGNAVALSSPINYERTILYPNSEYFVIVDRMEGTESWVYRNIFRPTSLSITPTADANKDGKYAESEIGHVNGALTIGSTPYNWQSLPYKTETPTGITTNGLTWTTTNPYGKAVTMNLVSAPSSEILVEKHVGRIAGYNAPSEVFSPVVWFRPPAAASEYRVTALLSRYSDEPVKNALEIPVSGTGHAIKVSSASSDDYIYTGKGVSSFAGFTTDADTVFFRKSGNNNEFTIINGSYLKRDNSTLVSVSNKINYLSLNQNGSIIKFSVKGESSADITLTNTVATSVLRDGVIYTNWVMDKKISTVIISTTLSEHLFEISSQNHLSIDPISNQKVNVSEQLQFPLKVTYTGAGVLQSSASNLPAHSVFNSTTQIFSWIPDANQTGNYTVTFKVTDGYLSDSKNVLITVDAANSHPPVLDEIGNKTVSVRSNLQFVVNAIDLDGDELTYSASGVPVNATFDCVNRTFSWTPGDDQAGAYDVTFSVSDGMFQVSKLAHILVNNGGNRAPAIDPVADASVMQGEKLIVNITASDPDGDVLTYSAANLPAGATFDPVNRQFTWSPANTQEGNYTVTFNVSDGFLTTSRNATFTAIAVKLNHAPYFIYNSTTILTYNVGTPILVNINAADIDNDNITYSATNLPTGATVDSATHKLSWTPGNDQAGTYDITLIISDGKLQSSKLLRLIIVGGNRAPVFGPLADASVNQKETITVMVTASDPDGDALTYSASDLPAGATFDPASRQFSWSPDYNQAGNYTVTFSVTDGSLSASRNVTFTAVKVNNAPYFIYNTTTTLTYTEGTPILVNINAADKDNDVITYSATNLPTGATVNSATHTLIWTPGNDQAGTYDITLIISDGKLQSSKLLRLIITDTPAPKEETPVTYYILLE